MGRWTAASDRDYDDEVEHGGMRRGLERTCAQCKRPFFITVSEAQDVPRDLLCDECCAIRDAEAKR